MLVIFYGHASGMARGRVRRTYIRTSHFMTFLHEAIFTGEQRRRKREGDRDQQRERMRNATEEQRQAPGQAERKRKRERRRNSTAER